MSQQIEENEIERDKEKEIEKDKEKEETAFIITGFEMIRFTLFTLNLFVIVIMQLRVPTRFASNVGLVDTFFGNTTNIFKQPYNERYATLQWIDQQAYGMYNLNRQTLGVEFSDFIPISKLRVTSTMLKTDTDTNLWNTNLNQEKSDRGNTRQYHYDQSQNGYQLYFLPYSVLQYDRINNYTESNKDIKFNNLRLLETGFLNSQTSQVKIDAAYYNANLNFIAVMQIQFNYSPQGKVTATLDNNSFIANSYLTSTDRIRLILELIFLVFFANYCIVEVLKIKAQIKKAFDDDYKKEMIAQKKKESMEQKLLTRNEFNLNNKQQTDEGNRKDILNTIVTVPNEQNLKDKIQQEFEENIRRVKKRLQLITLGLQRHVSDIWSAVDVTVLIIMGIAMGDWVKINFNAPVFIFLFGITQKSTNYNDYFLGEAAEDIELINDLFITEAITAKRYRRLVAIIGMFMTTKLIKYFVFVFADFQPYVDIILRVLKYMVSYMVTLIVIVVCITEFFYFYYGSYIQDFANFYDSLNYVFGQILGVNDQLDAIYAYDNTFTFVVELLVFLMIGCIILNMVYVFCIYEFAEEDKQNAIKLKNMPPADETSLSRHPIWYAYDVTEYVFLQFWFTLTLNRPELPQYKYRKEQRERIFEREFKVNFQVMHYDQNFQSIIDGKDQQNQGQQFKPKKFLLEEEKKQIIKKQKIELVQLIWRTLTLLLFLLLNFILVQVFYSPSKSFLQNDSINNKIRSGGSTSQNTQFNKIKTSKQVTDWIQNSFPLLFDQMVLGKRESQAIYQTPESYSKNSNETKKEQLISYLEDEYGFGNLTRGNSLNYYNIVINNLVRITIRKSKSVVNPDSQYSQIFPTVKTFFPQNPKDTSQSPNERQDPFYFMDDDITLLELHYLPSGGWGNGGGYQMVCDVEQVGTTIQNLITYGFIDFTLATITLEFVTINPVNQHYITSTVIHFTINPAGIVDVYGIDTQTFKQNALQTFEEVSILGLAVALFIFLAYYFIKTINIMRIKNIAYKRWYNTFVILIMSKAQIHFRNRRTPEFIRKLNYLIDIPQLLNLLFLMLMGFQISLIIYSILKVNSLLQYCKLFGTFVSVILKAPDFGFAPPQTVNAFFQSTQDLNSVSLLISIFASLSILVLVIEILYLLSDNKDFSILIESIKYSFTHIPYVFMILAFFILSFTFMAYFLIGNKQRDFNTFYGCLTEITSFVFYLYSMKYFRTINNAPEFFFLALPYIIISRYILMNIFSAIVFRAYQLTKLNAALKAKNEFQLSNLQDNLTIRDFFNFTIELFNYKEKLPKPQSDLYLLQIIKLFDSKGVYSKIRENIRNQMDLGNIQTWSEKCCQNIKEESEIIEPLDTACHEILQAYIKLNNEGNFQILELINEDPTRKEIEYGLKITYFDYYRSSCIQFDKFISFFNFRIDYLQRRMYHHLIKVKINNDVDREQEFQLRLIGRYESNLEANLNSLQYIRKEIEGMKLDQTIFNIDNSQIQKVQAFQNELSNQQTISTPLSFPRVKGSIKKSSNYNIFNKKTVGIKFQDSPDSLQESNIDLNFQRENPDQTN